MVGTIYLYLIVNFTILAFQYLRIIVHVTTWNIGILIHFEHGTYKLIIDITIINQPMVLISIILTQGSAASNFYQSPKD